MPVKILKPLSQEAYKDVLGCILPEYCDMTEAVYELNGNKRIFHKLDSPYCVTMWQMYKCTEQHIDSVPHELTLGVVLSGSAKLYSGHKHKRYVGTVSKGSVFVLKNAVYHGATLKSDDHLVFVVLDLKAKTMKGALQILKVAPIINVD